MGDRWACSGYILKWFWWRLIWRWTLIVQSPLNNLYNPLENPIVFKQRSGYFKLICDSWLFSRANEHWSIFKDFRLWLNRWVLWEDLSQRICLWLLHLRYLRAIINLRFDKGRSQGNRTQSITLAHLYIIDPWVRN